MLTIEYDDGPWHGTHASVDDLPASVDAPYPLDCGDFIEPMHCRYIAALDSHGEHRRAADGAWLYTYEVKPRR
ncbi:MULTISPECIES: hypothetical protein [Actinomycetes]|uniref:hypothetical protein n=1 Tax=Actinomycetes TaxID=1760 RepID=UPI00340840C7